MKNVPWVFILLSIQINILNAKLHDPQQYWREFLVNNGEEPYPKQCSDILNAFAESASNFTMCSIKNARPVRLCENCIDSFVVFRNTFNSLLNTVVNEISCRSIFISHDRLDTIFEYHASIMSIWDKGNCNGCFDWSNGAPIPSNQTEQFNKMYLATMACINNSNTMMVVNNSNDVCEKCMKLYIKLDEHYKSLSKDSIGVFSVCMDIVDSMNATRYIWSKGLNCCKLRRSPEIIFLCCTGIISILPVLFYLAVRYCGPIMDLPEVLKESRFKQTFIRTVHGRIN